MESIDDIFDAFEQVLELERVLGTRTVECDRALLVPAAPAKPPAAPTPSVAPASAETRSSAVVTAVPSERPRPSTVVPPLERPRPTAAPKPTSTKVDFAFVVTELPKGSAAELLGRMVAAMGYSMESVRVVTASSALAAKPEARVYIVLGSDAFRMFAPKQRAALGLWTAVDSVPTVVTYSPARILSYFGNDAEGLKKAKRQIWADLQSALARIGKRPPSR